MPIHAVLREESQVVGGMGHACTCARAICVVPVLCCAVLNCAVPCCAVLRCAVLHCAVLCRAIYDYLPKRRNCHMATTRAALPAAANYEMRQRHDEVGRTEKPEKERSEHLRNAEMASFCRALVSW